LDLDSYLKYTALKEEDTQTFVVDYRASFEMTHQCLLVSNETAIEEIKMATIYWWDDFEREDFERTEMGEDRLLMVDNS
jgi:hypothetical protein